MYLSSTWLGIYRQDQWGTHPYSSAINTDAYRTQPNLFRPYTGQPGRARAGAFDPGNMQVYPSDIRQVYPVGNRQVYPGGNRQAYPRMSLHLTVGNSSAFTRGLVDAISKWTSSARTALTAGYLH